MMKTVDGRRQTAPGGRRPPRARDVGAGVARFAGARVFHRLPFTDCCLPFTGYLRASHRRD
jgi:hypothetical protein